MSCRGNNKEGRRREKEKEEDEIKKKQGEIEGLRLTGSQKDQQTTKQVDTQGVQDQVDQEQGQSDPDPP